MILELVDRLPRIAEHRQADASIVARAQQFEVEFVQVVDLIDDEMAVRRSEEGADRLPDLGLACPERCGESRTNFVVRAGAGAQLLFVRLSLDEHHTRAASLGLLDDADLAVVDTDRQPRLPLATRAEEPGVRPHESFTWRLTWPFGHVSKPRPRR